MPKTPLALAALLLVMPACKGGRVDQCNRLIDKINALDLTPPKGEDEAAIGQLAAKAEDGARVLDTVDLKDPQLVGFRQQYQQNLRAFAAVNRAVAATMVEVKRLERSIDATAKMSELEKKLEAQRKEIDQHAQASGKLTEQINAYCSGR